MLLSRKSAFGIRVLKEHRGFLENSPSTFNQFPIRADATEECQRSAWVEKSSFFSVTINYQEHVIPRTVGNRGDNDKSVRKLQDPETLTEVRSILDLCNVFGRFVSK